MPPKYSFYKTFVVISLSFLSSCVSQPNQLELLVGDFGLEKTIVKGVNYPHLLVTNNLPGEVLHVYIEGDGLPWLNRYTVSNDPTPSNPLALDLMSQDSNFAIYLGRPCYFSIDSTECSATQWTNGRYGQDIIESMEAAIVAFTKIRKIEKIIIIGYSGGGVIAALLASRIRQTQAYVTIAANLDTDGWTRYHGYSPLDKSLNPASSIEMMRIMEIKGIHLSGKKDEIVPLEISSLFISKTKGKLIVFPDFDHICCWTKNWNDTFNNLRNEYLNLSTK